jgi:ABC-type branched-subunit amino acid transport system ATPase component
VSDPARGGASLGQASELETSDVLPLLQVVDLHVAYGAVAALSGISFSVFTGEIVTLIGANGAGKSTTMNTIMGLVKAQSGHVVFRAGEVTNKHAFELVRRGLSLSPEGRRLFLNLSVRENLELGGMLVKDKGRRAALLDGCSRSSPGSRNGWPRAPARYPAGSSRWWPSRVR